MASVEAPETLEGWYVQHEFYTIAWPEWRALEASRRETIVEELAAWLRQQSETEAGDSACYSVVGHKGDLLLTHFRPTLEALNEVKLSLRQTPFFEFLRPGYGYLSVIELGLYQIIGAVHRKLAAEGLSEGSETYEAAYQRELEAQKSTLDTQLYPDIPDARYQCFYPMNKRRGETQNWYALPMDERRQLMRGHGMVGRKFSGKVKQIISGSVGFDEWEWGVSLFADDPLVFKKLVYEMRFDEASSIYGLFGDFFVGIRLKPEEIGILLSGQQPQ